ncbi:group I truncated hemoglobin [Rickettsiella massiliensis]|uniref:group I truncated hemoglobin n=1 Tax=Rickettsiella massiliensis TaxID=676517 RepID=UPI00029B2BCD
MSSSTLFNKIGGQNTVNQAVDIFYRKILLDNRINHFFLDIDMNKQIQKQKGFLTLALGEPNHYTGKTLREGHAHLVKRGLSDQHVDYVLEHLTQSLIELGVTATDIAEVIAIANQVRDEVLNRGPND